MFYCNKCGEKNGWPTNTPLSSYGACECCEKLWACNDVPSSSLPLPKRTENKENKGNNMIFSKRLELSKEVEKYIKENGVKNDAFGVICALSSLGYLRETKRRI